MLYTFDTNIALYAFVDQRDPVKTRVSRELIEDLAQARSGVLSAQVLNEFCNVATRKLRDSVTEADLFHHVLTLSQFPVVGLTEAFVPGALRRVFDHQISYFDSLMVEAARAANVDVFYSEDLQHGMRFGYLQVIDPFL